MQSQSGVSFSSLLTQFCPPHSPLLGSPDPLSFHPRTIPCLPSLTILDSPLYSPRPTQVPPPQLPSSRLHKSLHFSAKGKPTQGRGSGCPGSLLHHCGAFAIFLLKELEQHQSRQCRFWLSEPSSTQAALKLIYREQSSELHWTRHRKLKIPIPVSHRAPKDL